VLEQMFGSSNDKRSSSNVPDNISSSFIHIDQDHEKQSSVQKEEVKSASLGKSDGPVSQTKTSSFGRTKVTLTEKEDCSTLTNDYDDDDTDDEYDDQELLLEFQKHVSKHIKLQNGQGDLLYSHEELIDSYALLEATHEVMVTTVKFS
jgi:hypothetical protein